MSSDENDIDDIFNTPEYLDPRIREKIQSSLGWIPNKSNLFWRGLVENQFDHDFRLERDLFEKFTQKCNGEVLCGLIIPIEVQIEAQPSPSLRSVDLSSQCYSTISIGDPTILSFVTGDRITRTISVLPPPVSERSIRPKVYFTRCSEMKHFKGNDTFNLVPGSKAKGLSLLSLLHEIPNVDSFNNPEWSIFNALGRNGWRKNSDRIFQVSKSKISLDKSQIHSEWQFWSDHIQSSLTSEHHILFMSKYQICDVCSCLSWMVKHTIDPLTSINCIPYKETLYNELSIHANLNEISRLNTEESSQNTEEVVVDITSPFSSSSTSNVC